MGNTENMWGDWGVSVLQVTPCEEGRVQMDGIGVWPTAHTRPHVADLSARFLWMQPDDRWMNEIGSPKNQQFLREKWLIIKMKQNQQGGEDGKKWSVSNTTAQQSRCVHHEKGLDEPRTSWDSVDPM